MSWVKSHWKILAIAFAVVVAVVVLIVVLAGENKDAGQVSESSSQTNADNKSENNEAVSVPAGFVSPVKVGDTVTFGAYEQNDEDAFRYQYYDYTDQNDKEPIEWIVLDVKGAKALLISRYALDYQKYEESRFKENLSWENSMIRGWLNESFLNAAFTPEQQTAILMTKVDCTENESLGWTPASGNATDDRIFLLSVGEAHRYFADDQARVCWSTLSAWGAGRWRGDGERMENEDGYPSVHWWLRSTSGGDSDYARSGCISENGEINSSSSITDARNGAWVRPALWVDLTSGLF